MGGRGFTRGSCIALAVLTVGCLGPAPRLVSPSPALSLHRPRIEVAPPAPEAHPESPSGRIHRILRERATLLTPEDQVRVAEAVAGTAREHGLDAFLLLAIIQAESGFDPAARGPRGALGLMQVRPFVAEAVAKRHELAWSGPRTLYDPASNVRIGASYLAELFDSYDEAELVLAAYNMGPTRVRRILRRGRIPRPAYVDAVLSHYEELTRR